MNDEITLGFNEDVSAKARTSTGHNIEYFHIYTDETINGVHTASLEYLNQAREVVGSDATTVIMIDNYNPTEHVLSAEDVFAYLESEGQLPDYWAYEADLVGNAKTLLENVTSPKLKAEYEKYIQKRGKYPCSLLTASWYLTRLGYLNHHGVISKLGATDDYKAVGNIHNILPADYKKVESRAFEIIRRSNFSEALSSIEEIFYDIEVEKDVKLF